MANGVFSFFFASAAADLIQACLEGQNWRSPYALTDICERMYRALALG